MYELLITNDVKLEHTFEGVQLQILVCDAFGSCNKKIVQINKETALKMIVLLAQSQLVDNHG